MVPKPSEMELLPTSDSVKQKPQVTFTENDEDSLSTEDRLAPPGIEDQTIRNGMCIKFTN